MEGLTKFKTVYSPDQENKIKNEFSRLTEVCYLDHAGATLYSRTQLQDVFCELTSTMFANPHVGNVLGKYTEDTIDVVRYRILEHCNTTSEEYSVIFTSGATGAIKIVGECFNYGRKGSLIYLNDNHTSVLGMRGLAPSSQEIYMDHAFEILETPEANCFNTCESNSLFVYPAQSNFNGTKYPLHWIKNVKRGRLHHFINDDSKWFVLLDAASFLSTSALDLKKHQADFVAVSFYKIFGYPTGLGALLVKNSSGGVLKKKYFGGGTVEMVLSSENIVEPRKILHERFEDGTPSFLSIASLKHGFDTIRRLNLNMEDISAHTFSLASYTYYNLAMLHHSNGAPLVIFYHSRAFGSKERQGGVVNFNLLRDTGEYIGYAEAGHICGDQLDLVAGRPTGTIRVSFGYMSTKEDADRLLRMLESCFIRQPHLQETPCKNGENPPGGDPIGNDEDLVKSRKLTREIQGSLEKIFLYPVKSCAAFEVKGQWEVTETGLRYDRQWMLVSSTGVCVSQKQNRKLCLIQPIIDLENKVLKLYFEDILDYVKVPLEQEDTQTEANLCQSKVCGDKIHGFDCGDNVAQWLSKKLDTPGLRLLKQGTPTSEQSSRNSRKGHNLNNLSLANKAQYLLINRSSVEWLIKKIPLNELDEDFDSITRRFRPNFVVNFKEAFAENFLNEIYIENLKFESTGKCTRCQMICIDQKTGSKTKEPLLTISREFQGKVSFGIYLSHIYEQTEDKVIRPKSNILAISFGNG